VLALGCLVRRPRGSIILLDVPDGDRKSAVDWTRICSGGSVIVSNISGR
jgi:hypothetical protein